MSKSANSEHDDTEIQSVRHTEAEQSLGAYMWATDPVYCIAGVVVALALGALPAILAWLLP